MRRGIENRIARLEALYVMERDPLTIALRAIDGLTRGLPPKTEAQRAEISAIVRERIEWAYARR